MWLDQPLEAQAWPETTQREGLFPVRLGVVPVREHVYGLAGVFAAAGTVVFVGQPAGDGCSEVCLEVHLEVCWQPLPLR